MTDPTDKELFDPVLAADEEGLHAGEDPKARSIKTIIRVMEHLDYVGSSFVGVPGSRCRGISCSTVFRAILK